MKKRAIAMTVAMCLVAALALTGCGSDNPYSKYDLSEYVKVGQYKGLEREELQVSVSDEEVSAQVQKNVEDTKTTDKIKEGNVAKGNVVNIDYEGKINGETFEGGTSTGYDLTIGSGQFIDGFEDGLIGKAVGSTQDLNLKFPKDYTNTDLAGKDVVFTVTINYIAKDNIPEYNDAWVAKNSDVKTVADYNKLVKDQLYDEKEESAKNNEISKLWTKVVESSEVLKYPEDEVDTYVKEIEQQYESVASSSGVELKDLWEQYGIESEEDYNEQNKQAAQAYVKEQMIMYDIAEKEGLSYSKEEEKELKDSIEEMGYTDETFRQNYGQDIDSYTVASLTFNKVGALIYDNAKTVKETTKATTEETTKETTTEATEATTAPSPEEDLSKDQDKGADDATSNDEAGGADA